MKVEIVDIEQKFKEYQDVGLFCGICTSSGLVMAFYLPLFAEAFRFSIWMIVAPMFVALACTAVLRLRRTRFSDQYPIRTWRTRMWILVLELGVVVAWLVITAWQIGWF